MKIGKFIQSKLDSKNMTQIELGEKLNLNQRTISSYCNDKTDPDLETLSKLCSILEIDANILLGINLDEKDEYIVQDERELALLRSFRGLPESKKKDFCESLQILASMIEN